MEEFEKVFNDFELKAMGLKNITAPKKVGVWHQYEGILEVVYEFKLEDISIFTTIVEREWVKREEIKETLLPKIKEEVKYINSKKNALYRKNQFEEIAKYLRYRENIHDTLGEYSRGLTIDENMRRLRKYLFEYIDKYTLENKLATFKDVYMAVMDGFAKNELQDFYKVLEIEQNKRIESLFGVK